MRVGAVVRLLPTLALGVALVVVVLLAHQSRSLRQELVRLRLEARTPPLGLPVRRSTALPSQVTRSRLARLQAGRSCSCSIPSARSAVRRSPNGASSHRAHVTPHQGSTSLA